MVEKIETRICKTCGETKPLEGFNAIRNKGVKTYYYSPLETVAKEYLNLSPEVARRKANAQSLPWPVISADGNKKSPKFVSVSALAEWLDQIENKAKDEWARVRN